jgi:hypothetical protein
MPALPKFLRYFSGDYGFFKLVAIKLWQLIFSIKYFIYEPDKAKAKLKRWIQARSATRDRD